MSIPSLTKTEDLQGLLQEIRSRNPNKISIVNDNDQWIIRVSNKDGSIQPAANITNVTKEMEFIVLPSGELKMQPRERQPTQTRYFIESIEPTREFQMEQQEIPQEAPRTIRIETNIPKYPTARMETRNPPLIRYSTVITEPDFDEEIQVARTSFVPQNTYPTTTRWQLVPEVVQQINPSVPESVNIQPSPFVYEAAPRMVYRAGARYFVG